MLVNVTTNKVMEVSSNADERGGMKILREVRESLAVERVERRRCTY